MRSGSKRLSPHPVRVTVAAAALGLWLLAPEAAGQAGVTPYWLGVDRGTRTVTAMLEVTTPPSLSSALLNGYRDGAVQIVVSVGWTVKWHWRNADSSAAHSLVVMAEREKLPAEGGSPAFPNAMSRMVTKGLGYGQEDATSFVADEPGWYWLLCGVPGHALGGEWLGLRVDPEAREVGIKNRER